MSKDIWHKADITPEEDSVIVVKSKRTGEYLVGSEFEFILENFTKWAYFDDLLACEQELYRTRKILDKAIWWLNKIVENHRFTPISTAEMALKEITALEQKDVKRKTKVYSKRFLPLVFILYGAKQRRPA